MSFIPFYKQPLLHYESFHDYCYNLKYLYDMLVIIKIFFLLKAPFEKWKDPYTHFTTRKYL